MKTSTRRNKKKGITRERQKAKEGSIQTLKK
jgi:hypothetical protein